MMAKRIYITSVIAALFVGGWFSYSRIEKSEIHQLRTDNRKLISERDFYAAQYVKSHPTTQPVVVVTKAEKQ